MDHYNWQPIDTAPRTGRQRIVLRCSGTDVPQEAYSDTWWVGGFSAGSHPTHWAKPLLPPTE